MTNELYLKLENVAQFENDIADLREAISELSRHYSPTQNLLDNLIFSLTKKEEAWREIESRADFKAAFKNRVEARTAYLKRYFKEA